MGRRFARLAVAGLLAMGVGPAALAQSESKWSVEGFGAMGSGAKTGDLDFDKTFGGGGGIGYVLRRNLQIRADGAAFSWDGQFTRPGGNVGVCFVSGSTRICFTGQSRPVDVKQTLKAVPFFVGARYFLGAKSLRPYVELGAGISPVKLEISTSGGSTTVSEEKSTKLGAIPGVGLEYRFGKTFGLGLGGRYYYFPKGVGAAADVEPSFFSAMASLVLHF